MGNTSALYLRWRHFEKRHVVEAAAIRAAIKEYYAVRDEETASEKLALLEGMLKKDHVEELHISPDPALFKGWASAMGLIFMYQDEKA